MRGRPKTPTQLKRLQGTDRADRANPSEPVPASGDPGCPAHLKGEARKEWTRITGELAKLDLLKVTDRAALAAYCVCYGDWIKAQNGINKKGQTYKANGLLKVNPLVRVAQDLLKLMRAYLVEFGLTPASRSRVHAPAQQTTDPMGDLLRDIAANQ